MIVLAVYLVTDICGCVCSVCYFLASNKLSVAYPEERHLISASPIKMRLAYRLVSVPALDTCLISFQS